MHGALELGTLLAAAHLERDDVTEFLYHPGGPKVLDAYARAYGVEPEHFHWSREVLERYGNMSSVTLHR